MSQEAKGKVWSGRFDEPVSDLVKRFTASVEFDRRLAEFDIEASLAHARMLAAVGVLGAQDLADIERGLAAIREEIRGGAFTWSSQACSIAAASCRSPRCSASTTITASARSSVCARVTRRTT